MKTKAKSRIKKSPEKIRALLATIGKRATKAQIAAYCGQVGRPFTDAENLAAHLKTL